MHAVVTDWVYEPLAPPEERMLIRQIAGLLAEVPLAQADRERALAPGHLDPSVFAQVSEPLTYKPDSGVVPALPPMRIPRRRMRKARSFYETRPIVGSVDAEPTAEEIRSSPARRRPGSGGRQAPVRAYSATTATAKLYEQYGEPMISKHGDATLMVWLVDSEGDGIVASRLSTRDVQQGETAMGQVHPALEGAKNHVLRPRLIIVTTENSGGLPYDERCDFELIEREIYAGRCRWVWYRDVKRLIRNVSPFYRFRDTLLETNTDLWLTEYAHRGGPVDWDSDDIQLGIEAILAERDRKGIYAQTHGPLMSRWVGEGRGWPGAKRFGFRRNKLTSYLEVDPEQWPLVRMMFETYVMIENGQGAGVRGVRAALAAAGCSLSESAIKKILADPIYCTGEHSIRRAGQLYECRPVMLEDPISADLYAKVQELRQLRRGKETRNPAGFFCLNGLVEHSCGCRLRAKRRGACLNYTHFPPPGEKVPDECHGWSIDARELEAAVIRELRRLAKCQKLQEEWAALARPQFAEPTPILDASGREALQAEIEKLTVTRDQLQGDFIDRIGKGQAPDDVLGAYHKLTGGLEEQLSALKERLARAELLDEMREVTRPAEDDPLLDVFLRVLTEETPEDPQHIRRRGAIVKSCLSKVVVYEGENGRPEIVLYGPLVPADVPPLRPLSPVRITRERLIEAVTGRDTADDDGVGEQDADDEGVGEQGAEEEGVGEQGGGEEGDFAVDDGDAGDSAQPDGKASVTTRLGPTPTLPKLGRPKGRRQGRRSGQSSPKCTAWVPAWVSPRSPVSASVRRWRVDTGD